MDAPKRECDARPTVFSRSTLGARRDWAGRAGASLGQAAANRQIHRRGSSE